MTSTYDQKGYGEQEIGFGQSLAILVVDFQLGFTESRFQLGGGPLVDGAVENTARVLKIAREHNIAEVRKEYIDDHHHIEWFARGLSEHPAGISKRRCRAVLENPCSAA